MTATTSTVRIQAGTVLTSPDGYRGEVFGIVPGKGAVPGTEVQIAMIAGNDGQTIELPVLSIVGMVSCGAWSIIQVCPGCGSETFVVCDLDLSNSVNSCKCGTLWSENVSEEWSLSVVRPLGTPVRFPNLDEKYFDFSDAERTYRRHGWSKAGVCVQIG